MKAIRESRIACCMGSVAVPSKTIRLITLNQGLGISAVAKTVGLKRQSVYRIRSESEKQMAALQAWYPEEFCTSDLTHVAR